MHKHVWLRGGSVALCSHGDETVDGRDPKTSVLGFGV